MIYLLILTRLWLDDPMVVTIFLSVSWTTVTNPAVDQDDRLPISWAQHCVCFGIKVALTCHIMIALMKKQGLDFGCTGS